MRDVAARLGVGENTLREWVRQGIGPGVVRVGRRVMVPEDEVQAWMKRNSTSGDQPA